MLVRDGSCNGRVCVSFSALIDQWLRLHKGEKIATLALEFLENLCFELIQRDNQLIVSDVGICILRVCRSGSGH
jgi:hypothetical protein